MNITKKRLIEIINEELSADINEYVTGPLKNTEYDDLEATEDPYGPKGSDPDFMFEKIQESSRILEALPLENLPQEVTEAAQNLRDALDKLSLEMDYQNT